MLRKPLILVGLPDNQIFGALTHRFVVAVAFLALALPSVGPLLDHHFAERQPNHVHVYFGERIVEHVHPYGLVHSHHPDIPNSPATRTGNADGIVYLTSGDAVGPGFLFLTVVSINTDLVFPDSGDSPLLLSLADQDHPLTEFFLSVPKRPPRA